MCDGRVFAHWVAGFSTALTQNEGEDSAPLAVYNSTYGHRHRRFFSRLNQLLCKLAIASESVLASFGGCSCARHNKPSRERGRV